jgi:xylose isomerase
VNQTTGFFKDQAPIRYEGPESTNPLSFRWYDPDHLVLGKRMEDHLRFCRLLLAFICLARERSFCGQTFDRPWFGNGIEDAKLKADVAFELFSLLGTPFLAFHDRDVAPEGKTLKESKKNLRTIADIFARKMEQTKVRLLWGTANLFSNRRFMGGAATNPDPDVFAYSAAQVKNVLEITHELGGENLYFGVAGKATRRCSTQI